MAYQYRRHWCCPTALQTALEVFGVRMGQERIAKILGTDADGTDETDLIQGLDSMGCQWHEIDTDDQQKARDWLIKFSPVAPLLLCVDSFDHWVTVAGCCGPCLWLLDSTRERWNTTRLGRWAVTPETVLDRWGMARRQYDGGAYYGVALLSVDSKKARRCATPRGGYADPGDP